MKTALRLVLGLVLAFVVVMAALAAYLAFLFDPNDYRERLTELVKTQTGRTLAIKGDIGLSFFPWLGFTLGAVELGTDGWIQNITGNLFSSEQGKALFIWTSAIMFGLRFCAHFIETKLKLSPIGLLLVLQFFDLLEAFGALGFVVSDK